MKLDMSDKILMALTARDKGEAALKVSEIRELLTGSHPAGGPPSASTVANRVSRLCLSGHMEALGYAAGGARCYDVTDLGRRRAIDLAVDNVDRGRVGGVS